MTPTPFAWSKRTCGIPFDVTFHIVENGQLHEVKAHKMILAMVSDIFKTMFFATEVGNKTANAIKIEKTTAPAFQIMIDAVNSSKSIADSLRGKSVQEIFDVVNLVERYQIPELMSAVQEFLSEYTITEDTVLEVAEEAMEYTNMFEDEANILLHACAKFLKAKFKDLDSVYTFAEANKDQKEVFSTLLAMMKNVTATESSDTNHDLVYAWIHRNKNRTCYHEDCSHVHPSIRDHGIHKDKLFEMIKDKMSYSEMEATLFFLSEEGHIYTTVDEDHFKTTMEYDDDDDINFRW